MKNLKNKINNIAIYYKVLTVLIVTGFCFWTGFVFLILPLREKKILEEQHYLSLQSEILMLQNYDISNADFTLLKNSITQNHDILKRRLPDKINGLENIEKVTELIRENKLKIKSLKLVEDSLKQNAVAKQIIECNISGDYMHVVKLLKDFDMREPLTEVKLLKLTSSTTGEVSINIQIITYSLK